MIENKLKITNKVELAKKERITILNSSSNSYLLYLINVKFLIIFLISYIK